MKSKINPSKIIHYTKAGISNTHKKIIKYGSEHKVGLAFWIFLIITFVVGFIYFENIKDFVERIVTSYGLIGIIITTVFTELVVMPIGPDIPLIAGVLLGLNPWLVLLYVLSGSYIAIIISYYIGWKIGIPGVERLMGTNNYEKVKKYETGGKIFLLLGALTPIPYIPYFAGVWKLSLKDTILYVALPRTVRLVAVFILTYYLGVAIFI